MHAVGLRRKISPEPDVVTVTVNDAGIIHGNASDQDIVYINHPWHKSPLLTVPHNLAVLSSRERTGLWPTKFSEY